MTKNVLFILAHQDDEYFALPWIREELHAGNQAFFLYLTDGGSRTPPGIRDAESLSALAHLGIPAMNVGFLGTRAHIPDGKLVANLGAALSSVEAWIQSHGVSPQRIYAPDYEGGHADHDAAHILAAVLVRRLNITPDAWGFSLYNGLDCPAPLFRTLRPLVRSGARRITYSIIEGLRAAFFCRRYPSQRRTWLGLFPEAFLRRVFRRTESVNPIALDKIARPHDGVLLYERLFGVDYSDFAAAASPFFDTASDAGAAQAAGARTKSSS